MAEAKHLRASGFAENRYLQQRSITNWNQPWVYMAIGQNPGTRWTTTRPLKTTTTGCFCHPKKKVPGVGFDPEPYTKEKTLLLKRILACGVTVLQSSIKFRLPLVFFPPLALLQSQAVGKGLTASYPRKKLVPGPKSGPSSWLVAFPGGSLSMETLSSFTGVIKAAYYVLFLGWPAQCSSLQVGSVSRQNQGIRNRWFGVSILPFYQPKKVIRPFQQTSLLLSKFSRFEHLYQ